MLIKFAVKNFRGFAEKIEWDLSHPNNYEYNKYAIKKGIIKNGIIYGPNGSGKSNFALALFDIETIIQILYIQEPPILLSSLSITSSLTMTLLNIDTRRIL